MGESLVDDVDILVDLDGAAVTAGFGADRDGQLEAEVLKFVAAPAVEGIFLLFVWIQVCFYFSHERKIYLS